MPWRKTFITDNTALVPSADGTCHEERGPCPWVCFRWSQWPSAALPTPVPRKRCRTQKGRDDQSCSQLCCSPLGVAALLSGSRSWAYRHTFPHMGLSRSLRNEVNIIYNIHPFLWEWSGGWRRARTWNQWLLGGWRNHLHSLLQSTQSGGLFPVWI